ncbi:MerR family transcriptional regulator [Streptomyces albus]|uniref:MerR family transcriptional regulator n=1 Tax=Streptomyces albus TaxID=1888 RepID=UPI0024ACFAB5|nr:MerR family transcriptional regulator [Streptomyces albus]MDI6409036.1 MerR family transcriptional regulator [Streptomyces albus]
MRIGDAAALVGVTPRALRYYEQRGLLRVRRNAVGHREYDEAELRRLRLVRGLLEAGLTVEDAHEILARLRSGPAAAPGAAAPGEDTDPCPARRVVHRRLSALDEDIAHLRRRRDRLAAQAEDRFAAVFGPASRS